MLRPAGAILSVLLVAGCAPVTLNSGPSAGHLRAEDAATFTEEGGVGLSPYAYALWRALPQHDFLEAVHA